MTDTATDSSAETTPSDGETFAPGEPCGVCRFPIGPGKICGNTVYASHGKGALPKYCGQEGQSQWQTQHGTEGDAGHRSDLAGYPRRRAGMSTSDAARLAAEEAARRGIGRRKAAEPEPAAAESAAATTTPEAPAESASAVDALAELALQFGRGVGAVRQEVEALREESAARAAEIAAEREQWAAEVEQEKAALEEEKQALAKDREAAKSDTERAVLEVKAADDARLTVEGELKAARGRIAELEQEIKSMREQHRRDLAEVRKHEEARYDRMVDAFAATRPMPELESETAGPEQPPTESVIADWRKRITAGHVTRRGEQWHTGNGFATRPGARALDWMLENGVIAIGKGDPAPVTVTSRK